MRSPFGERDGAFVEFEAEELVGIDGGDGRGGVAEIAEQAEHFALEALQVLEGDVEKIAGAARGVEHAHGAELSVEGADA